MIKALDMVREAPKYLGTAFNSIEERAKNAHLSLN